MKAFLSALIIPILFVIALSMILIGIAKAEDIPLQAKQYRGDLTRIARANFGIDAPIPIFAAQIHQESGWNVNAVSAVGAKGIAQFMPATAKWWCDLNKLSIAECQPTNPVWAVRSLVGYDAWLMHRISGETEFDKWWATLRSYNGGLGHWQKEARIASPSLEHTVIDENCGRASRAKVFCAENLGYPDRILRRIQPKYAGWGRIVAEAQ